MKEQDPDPECLKDGELVSPDDPDVCNGELTQSQSCQNEEACPIVCSESTPYTHQWSHWKSWGECSRTCGPGNRSRYRDCIFEGHPTSPYDCQSRTGGEYIKNEPCPNPKPCPAYEWGQWNSWTPCDEKCGGGRMTRTRYKDCWRTSDRREVFSKFCPGGDPNGERPYIEVEQCPHLAACPTWADWSPWTLCNKKCGLGMKRKSRQCKLGSRLVNNSECYGIDKASAYCNQHSCSDHMMYWKNKISNGYYMEVAASHLSGKGSVFQQCADYCFSMEGKR